ncbi:PREDICTED: auxin-induced protein 15A-like [Populus euphratica]|uniref:Auxin-induced protein 15A-like n=1 Tax=Populus euphratica TaxID=75702 RepID=A0AAJ6XUQ1_POPEU|nr:PREDICTED: auxin-induced protein 15A-like [Populus euphratica]
MALKMIKKGRFLKHCSSKCINLGTNWFMKHATCNHFQDWESRSLLPEDDYCIVPKDVPKGHLAVYVGEDCKRYVIKATLLKHPLFKALLDRTEEVFGFTTGSKLCIPCNESMFKSILHCVNSHQDRGFWSCL